ncbi:MAG TPA: glycerophosphodiester phosphodiesterase family protein, partial [bacterium]|nr:glycerophosphodiester phosphodiesterase family protein [bacterium]
MFRNTIFFSTLMLCAVSAVLHAGTAIIAHRGASGLAPENTMAAYAKAVEIGADCFELDVWLSSDDSLMLMHDEAVARTTGAGGTIPTMTYQQLRALDAGSWFSPLFAGEKIPTLAEALDLALRASYRVGVVIEIKSTAPTVVEKVVAAVQQRGLQDRVIISSFNFSHLSRSKQLDPSIPVQLFGTIALAQIKQVASIGGEWVGTDGAITTALLDSAHARGVKMNKWTVNSASEMLPLIKLGADAFTTNFPDIARALLDTTPPGEVVLLPPVVDETRIGLSWLPAEDPESPSITYEIYRDTRAQPEILLATVIDTTAYIDDTRLESTQFFYRIRAKNTAGLYSLTYSNEAQATTAPDLRPPQVTAVRAYGRPDHLVIRFNERVEGESAQAAANYRIEPGVTVTSAR